MKTNGFAKVFILAAVMLFGASLTVLGIPSTDEIDVVSGDVQIDISDSVMNVNVSSDKAIINMDTFNIDQGERVNFYGSQSEVLARVTGGTPSVISGDLYSELVLLALVNEAGIHVTETGNIEARNIILSTRDITDSNFISSNYLFEKLSKEYQDMLLLNEGKISLSDGGFGVLIAGAIENRGLITARLGTIALASGDAVKFDFSSDGRIAIAINRKVASKVYDYEGNAVTDQIKNTGILRAVGGTIILKAESLTNVFRNAINLEGIVEASRAEDHDGRIVLVADGNVIVNTKLEAPKVEVLAVKVEGILEEEVEILAEEINIKAYEITIDTKANSLHIVKIEDDIIVEEAEIVEVDGVEIVKMVAKEMGTITYLKNSDITLEAPRGEVNTAPGVFIPGNQVKLSGKKIGSYDNPVGVSANTTYINRLQGIIDISEMWGMGTTVTIRGPAPSESADSSWGAVSYPKTSELILEAEKTTVSSALQKQGFVYLLGDITFHNFECVTPGAEIYFEPGKTYTFRENFKIQGGYGEHVKLLSHADGEEWYIGIDGEYDITYAWVKDSHNVNTEEIIMTESTNRGNSHNWDPTGYWTGLVNQYWSVPGNWTGFGGAVPGSGDDVIFTNTYMRNTILRSAITVDAAFGGTVNNLTVTGFSGEITLERDLTILGTFSMDSGGFVETVAFDGVTDPFEVTAAVYDVDSGPVPMFRDFSAGTAARRVTSAAELQAIGASPEALARDYVQYGDIDILGEGITNFLPIEPFGGSYNGLNYIIYNLVIDSTDYGVGLFGSASGGGYPWDGLRNIHLRDIDITVTGDAKNSIGGLVGTGGAYIYHCSATGTITINGGYGWGIGGLVGNQPWSSVVFSYADVDISKNGTLGGAAVGGFIGVSGATVVNCYSWGDVEGFDYVASFIGQQGGGNDIITSYSTGSGGPFVAWLVSPAKIINTGWDISNEPGHIWVSAGQLRLQSEYTTNITNASELQMMILHPELDYMLINDIDASETASWNGGAGFEPIGDRTRPFTGDFNGNLYTITGLTINRPTEDDVGLIGVLNVLNGALVQDVILVDPVISGNNAGALVGYNVQDGVTGIVGSYSNRIYNVIDLQLMENNRDGDYVLMSDIDASDTQNWNSGWGFNSIGDFTGTFDGSFKTITDYYSIRGGLFDTATDSGTRIENLNMVNVYVWNFASSYAGAIANVLKDGAVVQNVYTSGSVRGSFSAGGLVGELRSGRIESSYSSADIFTAYYTGGLVGLMAGGSVGAPTPFIRNSYFVGTVENLGMASGGAAGGLVGYRVVGDLYYCYSAAPVTTSSFVQSGGLIGKGLPDTTQNCFWDIEVSGQITSAGGGTGKTTAEMMTQSTYDPPWDFTVPGTWVMTGYPRLQWLHTTNITNVYQLQMISLDPAADYVLLNDIDASIARDWNGGSGFEPISSFIGTFDGGYNTIDGYFSTKGGLFDYVSESGTIVENLGMTNVDIRQTAENRGADYAAFGAIANTLQNSAIIRNSYATGELRSAFPGAMSIIRAGGLVGESYSGHIESSFSDVDIIIDNTGYTYDWKVVGGLVGQMGASPPHSLPSIRDSYAIGSITNSGPVQYNSVTGGLVGWRIRGNLYDCYAAGPMTINGGTRTGGLVGWTSTIGDATSNCFWDIDATGQTTSSDGGTGRSTSVMMTESNFSDAGWDISDTLGDTWTIAGYPHLQWEYSTEITNVYQLQMMKLDTAATYTLANDIDASETGPESLYPGYLGWHGGLGFEPVGTFSGTLDGQGYTVNNLTISRGNENIVGLFSTVDGGEIQDIGLVDVSVLGRYEVGGLVGSLTSGSITNSYTTGEISASNQYYDNSVGGLVGRSWGDIVNSYSTANITGTERGFAGGLVGRNWGTVTDSRYTAGTVNLGLFGLNNAGGIVGQNESAGVISGCFSDGNVIAWGDAGGLVGTNYGTIVDSYSRSAVTATGRGGGLVGANRGSITTSYSDGTVSGGSLLGGLVGFDYQGSIDNSYSTTEVTGTSGFCGGLVGGLSESTITNSYAAGRVEGGDPDTTGGFIGGLFGGGRPGPGPPGGGGAPGTYQNNYWDVNSSGQATSEGEAPGEVEGKITRDMMRQSTFDPEWDFSIPGTWIMAGYPHLQWENVSGSSVITNVYQLQLMSLDLDADYTLGNDIDASETRYWNWTGSGDTYQGFIPVSTFEGTFNGSGYAIIGLYVNSPSEAGLFGWVGSEGVITNVGLENAEIHGDSSVGGIAGHLFGDIFNSYVTGSVSGGDYVGGIAGFVDSDLTGPFITDCYSSADISGRDTLGGLVGENYGVISNCYSTGNVTGTGTTVGGFVGANPSSGNISYSFATGNVEGVSSSDHVGPFFGYVGYTSPWTQLYYAGTATNNGTGGTNTVIPSTTAGDLKIYDHSHPVYGNWDFWPSGTNNTWFMAGYPHLSMEHSTNIRNVHQLQMITLDPAADYTILNNINASGTANWNWNGSQYEGFSPIAGIFQGSLNGGGYDISGLTINSTSSTRVGLLAATGLSSQISDVHLTSLNIMASGIDLYVGGLVAENFGTIDNSSVEGTVTADNRSLTSGEHATVGGLVAYNYGDITSSRVEVLEPGINAFGAANSADDEGGEAHAGGLVAHNYANITDCAVYGAGEVTAVGGGGGAGERGGTAYAGGLLATSGPVGLGDSTTIKTSYATVNVYGEGGFGDKDCYAYVGGLIGANSSFIRNCYSWGEVYADAEHFVAAGGLVGGNYVSVDLLDPDLQYAIRFSYSTGRTTASGSGDIFEGGFLGHEGTGAGAYDSCFWDYQTAVRVSTWDATDLAGNPVDLAGVTGANTPSMQTESTFTSAGWDFFGEDINGTDDLWSMIDYPHLAMERSTNITSIYQLQLMALDPTADYTITGDIDASETQNWNWNGSEYEGFQPVGTLTNPFTGTFDGGSYSISDLYINRPTEDYVALFGYIDGTTPDQIQNVNLVDADITGGTNTGGLVAYNTQPGVTGIANATSNNIYNVLDLQLIQNDLGGDYTLMNDIDATDTQNWNWNGSENEGFDPIGDSTNPFTGILDGDSHTITGLTINRPAENDVGLIGGLNGTIQEVVLVDPVVAGDNAGALVGYNVQSGVSGISSSYSNYIYNVLDLQLIQNALNGDYTLMNDIDAADTRNWNWDPSASEYRGFDPLGGYYKLPDALSGSLDGQGYIISDLYINRPNNSYVGLFGGVHYNGGANFDMVTNLGLINPAITGRDNTGGIVGVISGGRVSECFVDGGSVTGRNSTGGLVGWMVSGFLTSDSYVAESYSTATVTGNNNVGGLAGYVGTGPGGGAYIRDSYASGNVIASGNNVGGLVGANIADTSSYVDPFAAISEINRCYAASTISAPNATSIGGLVGRNYEAGDIAYARVYNSYYDSTISGQSDTGKGEPRSTADMMTQSTFDPPWDFTVPGVWFMAGYPHLQMEHSMRIRNVYQLQMMALDLTADYTLMNNIDATETSGWNSNAGFIPVGDSANRFEGSLNGAGFEVNGLTINANGIEDVGLFGTAGGVTLQNIKLRNVDIAGTRNEKINVGGLVGTLATMTDPASITNCSVAGSVIGISTEDGRGARVGGLLGSIDTNGTGSVTITDSYSECSVESRAWAAMAGGLIGRTHAEDADIDISRSYTSVGPVIALGRTTGWPDSVAAAGGLIGSHRAPSANVTITDTYSSCNVRAEVLTPQGGIHAGGLMGANHDDSSTTVSNSYSTGVVTGVGGGSIEEHVGGFVGRNQGGAVYNDCFWDIDSSGMTSGVGLGSSSVGITGRTTDLMMQQSSFTNWDFYDRSSDPDGVWQEGEGTWEIVNGETYPFFPWRYPNGANGIYGVALQSDGVTPLGPGLDVRLSINNETHTATTQTRSDGSYYLLLDAGNLALNDNVLLYLNDGATNGNMLVLSDGTGGSDFDILADTVIARHDNAGPVTNADFAAAFIPGEYPDDLLFTMDGPVLDVDGIFLIPEGSTFAPGADMEVAGSWTNNGDFVHGGHQVTFDTTAPAVISGFNTFGDFTSTTPGKVFYFPPGSGTVNGESQVITGDLTIIGAPGNVIQLLSQDTPNQWHILPQGAVELKYVYIQDGVYDGTDPLIDYDNTTVTLVNVGGNWRAEDESQQTGSTEEINKTTDNVIPPDPFNTGGGGPGVPSGDPLSDFSSGAGSNGDFINTGGAEGATAADGEYVESPGGLMFLLEYVDRTGKKYRRLVPAGRYITTVIVIEGKVAVADVTEEGEVDSANEKLLGPGEELSVEREVGEEDSLRDRIYKAIDSLSSDKKRQLLRLIFPEEPRKAKPDKEKKGLAEKVDAKTPEAELIEHFVPEAAPGQLLPAGPAPGMLQPELAAEPGKGINIDPLVDRIYDSYKALDMIAETKDQANAQIDILTGPSSTEDEKVDAVENIFDQVEGIR